MVRRPVVSTSLKSIGYDQSTKTLEVELLQGAIYLYSDIPASLYRDLMNANSRGSFFHSNIRDAGYPYRQIR
jgi:hypothetical protein